MQPSVAIPAAPAPAPVRPAARWAVIAVFGVFAVGHLWDFVTFQEHWPWSPYRMYAQAKGNTHHAFEIWGVLATPLPDGTTEVKLKPHGYALPLADLRTTYGSGKSKGRKQTVEKLNTFYSYYSGLRRRRGPKVGPELSGMRFYKLTWTLLPGMPNVNTPDKRELVAATTPGKKARRKAATTQAATVPTTTAPAATTLPAVKKEEGASR